MKHIFLGFQIILNKTLHANFYSAPICTQIKQSPPFGLSAILLREIKVFSQKKKIIIREEEIKSCGKVRPASAFAHR